MKPIERRLRAAANPYSTAFSRWWCHTGRYMLPSRVSHRPASRIGPDRIAAERRRHQVSEAVMVKRRAAIDALFEATYEDGNEVP